MFTLPSMSQVVSQFGQSDSFAPGSWLRERGQALDSVLYLESGTVILGIRQDSVMRHQLGQVNGPAWLDATFALQQRPPCLDMQAQTAGRIYAISLKQFRSSVVELPVTVQALLADLAKAYCVQMELAVGRLAQDAEARCAQWLLNHACPSLAGDGLNVTLKARKRLIAAQLGIAPETFSRVLKHLRDHGLIAGRGNIIELPRPAALAALAGGKC